MSDSEFHCHGGVNLESSNALVAMCRPTWKMSFLFYSDSHLPCNASKQQCQISKGREYLPQSGFMRILKRTFIEGESFPTLLGIEEGNYLSGVTGQKQKKQNKIISKGFTKYIILQKIRSLFMFIEREHPPCVDTPGSKTTDQMTAGSQLSWPGHVLFHPSCTLRT